MADNEAIVQEFIELTGVPKKHAEEILKRYNWNKEEAVEAFFAGADEDEDMETDIPTSSKPSSNIPVASGSSASSKKASMLDVWEEERKKKGKDGQYFYVGGEHTGEVVIGPDKKDKSDLVKRLFESAKEHGAEPVSPDEDQQDRKPKPKAFAGSGYKLGSGGEASSVKPAAEEDPHDKPPRTFRLRMWENGFSIDDGELREYENPENQRFLAAVSQGRIPEELYRQAAGAEVHVDLEDRRTEEYTPPARPKVVAFSGEGNRLGSVVPPMSTDPPKPAATPATAAQPAAKQEDVKLDVDESQPVTTLQIRLADGSRLVTKANHTHTVLQIRDLIRRARPNLARTPFTLMTMFPNKEITDDSQTIAAAGLLNAAIIQRAGKAA